MPDMKRIFDNQTNKFVGGILAAIFALLVLFVVLVFGDALDADIFGATANISNETATADVGNSAGNALLNNLGPILIPAIVVIAFLVILVKNIM